MIDLSLQTFAVKSVIHLSSNLVNVLESNPNIKAFKLDIYFGVPANEKEEGTNNGRFYLLTSIDEYRAVSADLNRFPQLQLALDGRLSALLDKRVCYGEYISKLELSQYGLEERPDEDKQVKYFSLG